MTISIDNVLFVLMDSSRAPLVPAAVDPTPRSSPVRVERCPRCRTKLLEELPDEVLIRNAILRVDTHTRGVMAKCPRCKTWVGVPLQYIR